LGFFLPEIKRNPCVYCGSAEIHHLIISSFTLYELEAILVQAIYDLSGRRLDNDWNELPQGIYVIRVNGKQIKVKK
jgi:hypothetical protein